MRNGARVRVWCCAASTGEEAYSIAMTCAEIGPPAARAEIVASDIDTEALAVAARGVYADGARGLSAERLRRHFLRGSGPNAGLVRVRPELAGRIALRPHNLADDGVPPGKAYDFVFCRNVLVYFDAATQRRVLERLHAALAPGGLLFVGGAESLPADAKRLFRPRGHAIHERI